MGSKEKNYCTSPQSLLKVSFPLMLSSVSLSLMIIIDRLMLAYYSPFEMNAAASAGIVAFTIVFSMMSIATICEVFVGQLNGSNNKHECAQPAWQMIIFSLLCGLLFVPIGIWGYEYLVPPKYLDASRTYFQLYLYFGVFAVMTAALNGFFAGIGKTKIISVAMIGGHVLKIIISYVLIFGNQDWIAPMGIDGAAISNAVAEVFSVLVLWCAFLSKENRQCFYTHKPVWVPKSFKQCLKVGYPNAMAHTLELAAWSVIFHIASYASSDHVTVLVMGQNIFILFTCIADGLSKGVTAITSNLIGARKESMIHTVFSKALQIQICVMICFALPLIWFPEYLADIFELEKRDPLVSPNIIHQTVVTCRFVWIYLFLDGITWIISGILTSAGDTRFIMLCKTITVWLGLVIPSYVAFQYWHLLPEYQWGIGCGYTLLCLIFFSIRYKKGQWLKLARLVV